MDNFIILIFSGVILLTAVGIIIQRRYYRKVIKTKDNGIVQHIRQQDRLEKELTYINVEKKVMEKMLETKFDAVALVTHLPKLNKSSEREKVKSGTSAGSVTKKETIKN